MNLLVKSTGPAQCSISHSSHRNGPLGKNRTVSGHIASQPSNILKSGDVIGLVSGLYSISSKVFSSFSLPLYKLLDPESHLRNTTTGQHRLSEELVPLVCFWMNILLSSNILHACITSPRKVNPTLLFSRPLSSADPFQPSHYVVFPNRVCTGTLLPVGCASAVFILLLWI